jgi:hypothetical protein
MTRWVLEDDSTGGVCVTALINERCRSSYQILHYVQNDINGLLASALRRWRDGQHDKVGFCVVRHTERRGGVNNGGVTAYAGRGLWRREIIFNNYICFTWQIVNILL